MTQPAPSLKARALRLLSQREYSRAELTRKLEAYAQTPEALTLALDELQTRGYISEQRVLEAVLHRRAAKLGSARLQQELQARGLAPESVRAAVADLQTSERERALAVWTKKFGQAPQDVQAAARQMRFLAARGFGGDVIRQVVPSPRRSGA